MLLENERLDDLHRNNYKIIQNPNGFCFGQDAVILSGFAKVKKGEVALDLCTGTGIIPILLEAKTNGKHFSAIEIQNVSYDMALRSVKYNGLEDKIDVICGDIKNIEDFFKIQSFDVVTCNPPYMVSGSGNINDASPKALARHEIACNIDDVFRACNKMLKFGGRLYMIHRPERLVDIFECGRKYKIEPKVVRMVVPYENKEPGLVLLECVKGGKPSLKFEKNLVVYNADNSYTREVYEIYYK
jgi:ribosomal protein L11 methyltransferase (prmA)